MPSSVLRCPQRRANFGDDGADQYENRNAAGPDYQGLAAGLGTSIDF
jgi:hypothetical protein